MVRFEGGYRRGCYEGEECVCTGAGDVVLDPEGSQLLAWTELIVRKCLHVAYVKEARFLAGPMVRLSNAHIAVLYRHRITAEGNKFGAMSSMKVVERSLCWLFICPSFRGGRAQRPVQHRFPC